MHTQSTPVHIKLWHHDFWRLSLANMLLTMSVYMLIPVLPLIVSKTGLPVHVAVCVSGLCTGVFLLGGFCSYLIQRYRRNMVCIWAIAASVICIAVMYYVLHYLHFADSGTTWWVISALSLMLGAVSGLARIVLMGTLIVDSCESFLRTEANYASSWFGRFSLSLGPVLSLVVYKRYGFDGVLLVSAVCSLISIVLIRLVHFPFKAPDDNLSFFSSDRFFLPQGIWLFVNFMLTTAVIGMLLTLPHPPMFYGMIMVGFFFALMAQKFVFVNAELKSEIVSGLILIISALLMLHSHNDMALRYISPVFTGIGIGLISSRYLLFFIKLSRHCQRGTSQSTYILAWEAGIAIGLFAGYAFFYSAPAYLLVAALSLTVVSLLMYLLFTHSWYIMNKNR